MSKQPGSTYVGYAIDQLSGLIKVCQTHTNHRKYGTYSLGVVNKAFNAALKVITVPAGALTDVVKAGLTTSCDLVACATAKLNFLNKYK